MTGVIAIDESGDLGPNGSMVFAMAAIVMLRTRHLLSVAKMIPNDGMEHKWGNTDDKTRRKMFTELSRCQFSIAYATLNKDHPETGMRVFGNELYEIFIRQVLADAMAALPCRDVNVLVDRCRFITLERLREIAYEEAAKAGVNIKRCEKITSNQNRCIQIVDYIVGAARAEIEDDNDTIQLVSEKISVARRY